MPSTTYPAYPTANEEPDLAMNSTLDEVTGGPPVGEGDGDFMTRPPTVPLSREAMLAIAVYLTVVGKKFKSKLNFFRRYFGL